MGFYPLIGGDIGGILCFRGFWRMMWCIDDGMIRWGLLSDEIDKAAAGLFLGILAAGAPHRIVAIGMA